MLTQTQLDRRHEVKASKEVAASSPAEGGTYIMWGVNLGSSHPQSSSKTPATTTPALSSNPSKFRNVLTRPGLEPTNVKKVTYTDKTSLVVTTVNFSENVN